jgi:hypothetical protein
MPLFHSQFCICLLAAAGLAYWDTHLLVMQEVVPGDSLDPWFPYTMPMLGPFGPFSAVIGFGPLPLPQGGATGADS